MKEQASRNKNDFPGESIGMTTNRHEEVKKKWKNSVNAPSTPHYNKKKTTKKIGPFFLLIDL